MAVRYLDEHEDRSKFCKGDCEIEGMSGSIICHGFVAKTNADRIRSMTDEELAEWLEKIDPCFDCFDCRFNTKCNWNHQVEKIDWLKQEAKHEQEP